jgi:hypothetical protein
MNTTKKQEQLTQTCTAKGCSEPGIYEMEVLFLKRKGWFCQQCKDRLRSEGLLVQQQTSADTIGGQKI